MHPDISNSAAGRNHRLAGIKRCGNTDGLDRNVYAHTAGQFKNTFNRVFGLDVDDVGRTETCGHLEPIAVAVDHDQLARGIKLRG